MTREERDSIFLFKNKTIHRIPILPQPAYYDFIGMVKWEDDFNNQGKYKFIHPISKDVKFIRPKFRVGDTLKLVKFKNYICITKVLINKIQDWDIEKMTAEGKNSFQGMEHDELYLNVLKSRYEKSWDANLKKDDESLLYHNNPWVWEIHFHPTNRESIKITNRRKR